MTVSNLQREEILCSLTAKNTRNFFFVLLASVSSVLSIFIVSVIRKPSTLLSMISHTAALLGKKPPLSSNLSSRYLGETLYGDGVPGVDAEFSISKSCRFLLTAGEWKGFISLVCSRGCNFTTLFLLSAGCRAPKGRGEDCLGDAL